MCPRQVPFDAHSISGLVQKICYGPLPIAAASRESADYSLNCELKTHWVIVLETIPDVRRFQTLIRTSYDGHLDAGSNSLDHFGTSPNFWAALSSSGLREAYFCAGGLVSAVDIPCLFVRSFVCLHISHILGRLVDYISPCFLYIYIQYIYILYIYIYILILQTCWFKSWFPGSQVCNACNAEGSAGSFWTEIPRRGPRPMRWEP